MRNLFTSVIIAAAIAAPSIVDAKGMTTIAEAAKAQQTFSEWGIKAGLNFQQLNGAPFTNTFNQGFAGGLYFAKHGELVGIKIEVNANTAQYTTIRPASYTYSLDLAKSDTVTKGKFDAMYINIPVIFEVRPNKHITFEFGAQYSDMFSLKDNNGAFTKAWNTDKILKTGDISALMGMEVALTSKLKLGARLAMSLQDVNNLKFPVLTDSWMYTRAQVFVVYRLKKILPKKFK